MTLPETHQALVLTTLTSPPDLKVTSLPFPAAIPGAATVQILSAQVLAYANQLFSGALPYPLSLPLTVGAGAVGRIADVGSDATSLNPGQLVFIEPTIRGRDEPDNQILLGIHGGANQNARKLMDGEWRHGTFAEYARVPLENVFSLNEDTLCQKLGYGVHELAYLPRLLVPMGGLVQLDVKSGDRVVIAPATGQFGGAAVEVARAMGADVVLCGRGGDKLEGMKKTFEDKGGKGGKIDVVVLSGDVEKDAGAIRATGVVDKYLDFSPAAAAKSSHISSCLMALKKGGCACFQGGIASTVEIPYGLLMFNNLKVSGKFMYERDAIKRLVRLVESGRLKLGEEKAGTKVVGKFGLHEWKEAVELAEKENGWGRQVVFAP